jgi:hypothetical protein
MRIIRLIPITGMLLLGGAPLASQQSADEAGVRAALNHYIQGHATGDGSHMRIAFHPNANLYFIRDGKYVERTSADYAAGFSGRPPADEAQRKRRIESVDIAGTAAQAKIVLEYPGVTFTDFMTLLKIDGEWKIVAKVFHAERK